MQQKVGDYFAACMDTAGHRRRAASPRSPPSCAQVDALTSRHELLAELARLDRTQAHGTFFFDSGTEQDAVDSSA